MFRPLIAFACLFSSCALAQWQWVDPLPNGNFTTSLIWDGTRFVGLDIAGNANTSTDALSWTSHSTGSPSLHTLAWNGTRYVAVGFSGEIRTSEDGDIWVARTSGTSETLWSVTWTGTQFVAVGGTWTGEPDTGDAMILTSPDGIDWVTQATPAGVTAQLFDVVATGDHSLVAVGFYGLVMTSPDAVTWTRRDSGVSDNLDSVASSGTAYVATGQAGTLIESPDGAAWGSVDLGVFSLDRVIWTGTTFVASGGGGTLSTSADGTHWTMQSSGTDDDLYTLAASPSQVVAVGVQGTTVASADAEHWNVTSRRLTSEGLNAVAWNGQRFAATGDGGSVLLSLDGIDWEVTPVQLPFVANAIAAGDGGFVVVGEQGSIATSSDGIAWTQQMSDTTADLFGVTFGNHAYVAVGQFPGSLLGGPGVGMILTSPDGVQWATEDSQALAGDRINGVAWAGTQFVAVGGGPTPIFTSADGHAWERRQLAPSGGTGPSLLRVASNGSEIVAVGNAGEIPIDPRVIATSTDGVSWTFRPAPVNVLYATGLTDVAWVGGRFVAVGGFGIVLTSNDGIAWQADESHSAAQLTALASAGLQCIAVGSEGAILRNANCGVDAIFADGFNLP